MLTPKFDYVNFWSRSGELDSLFPHYASPVHELAVNELSPLLRVSLSREPHVSVKGPASDFPLPEFGNRELGQQLRLSAGFDHDRKVAGSSPCRSGRRIFFSRVNFLCWLLFRYPFYARVTAIAHERSGHSAKCPGGRLQLNTHAPYVCGFEVIL